jgi:hypothetical protein
MGMNWSKFNFRVRFDAHREIFVLLVSPVHNEGAARYGNREYEAYVVSMSPNVFSVYIPVDEIPDGFFVIGAELPLGVCLIGMRFIAGKACFKFELSNEALIQATPLIYRNYIKALINEGVIFEVFAQQ